MATIKVRQNGPYLVEGDDVTVVDWNGNQYQIAKRPFALFGDGNEIRDYIYIDDISAVITAVMQNPPSNNIFNVGTGRPHTSKEIIQAVTRQFELPKVPILFQPRRLGDVRCSLLDMAKFEKTYGLRCTTTLKEGLKKYAEQESLAVAV